MTFWLPSLSLLVPMLPLSNHCGREQTIYRSLTWPLSCFRTAHHHCHRTPYPIRHTTPRLTFRLSLPLVTYPGTTYCHCYRSVYLCHHRSVDRLPLSSLKRVPIMSRLPLSKRVPLSSSKRSLSIVAGIEACTDNYLDRYHYLSVYHLPALPSSKRY